MYFLRKMTLIYQCAIVAVGYIVVLPHEVAKRCMHQGRLLRMIKIKLKAYSFYSLSSLFIIA